MTDDSHTVERPENQAFDAQINALVQDAESMRVAFMKRHRARGFVATTISLVSISIGSIGFGWFLLVSGDLVRAVGCMVLAIAIPALSYIWSANILKYYKQQYKQTFLPRLAKALGGFKFFPTRGITRKVILKTGLIPKHDIYEAEDCFMGTYKGVKVMFSEARLKFNKSHAEPAFDGIFVLLESPQDVFDGHTILSADPHKVKAWQNTRWQKLTPFDLPHDESIVAKFWGFSDAIEKARDFVDVPLLKEISEACSVFSNAQISVAFFRKKYVFMMIPYSGDMFEPSSINIPIATKQHAAQCKKEIHQILEIIDVFELYRPSTQEAFNTEH